MQRDKAGFHSCGMTRVWGSGPFLGHIVIEGPRNLKIRGQVLRPPANSSSRSILAGVRAPPTQMHPSLRLWKPELMKFQKDETVWVWASAWDADGAAEGPQPRRELNEFVRELKTDDFNQQGGKKMTSWLQLTERGSVWLPGPARRHF